MGESSHAKECENASKFTPAEQHYHIASTNHHLYLDDRLDINPNWRAREIYRI
jgi:hypothetical protein